MIIIIHRSENRKTLITNNKEQKQPANLKKEKKPQQYML